MFSESDEEEPYTVHRVKDTVNAAPAVEVSPQHPAIEETKEEEQAAADGVSPLARYYRLGTEQRHAFDEHMRRLRSETQKSEREREFRQQHPFHPVRHSTTAGDAERPKAQRTEEITAASHTTPSPVRPVFDRLAAQAVQLELRRRHREEQKRRAEAAALRDAFQPEINYRPPMHADPLHPADDIPVEERLLHYGETVARERQRRQEKKAYEERAALAAAQAAVVGSTAGQPIDSVERRRLRMAFEERNERFVETRAQHRRQAEAEAAEAHSFQPQISATSAALDEARRRETEEVRRAELQAILRHNRSFGDASLSFDVQNTSGGREVSRRSDALYAQAVARQRQQTEVRGRVGESSSSDVAATTTTSAGAAAAAHTHQPVTNPNSAKWIASSAHRHFFEQDFVQRQALYERVREEEASLKAAAQHSEGAPSTNAVKDGGESVPSPRKAVTTKELNERLYYGARKAGEVAERRRAASLNARDCPFRPALAPGTNSVLQRMKSARDCDVVRRLTATTTTSDSARRTATLNPEKEGLYAASPSSRRTRSATTSLSNGGRRADSASSSAPSTTAGERVLEETTAPAPAPAAPPSPRRRVVVSRDQVEHFYQRQLTFLQERQDLIQERREGDAVQELVECTFRPRTNAEPASKPTSAGDEEGPSVSHVTGVSGFLERQKLARQRKAEHDELVRTMGLPRTKASGSSSARFTAGPTLLSPFTLQTSQRRRRSSCSAADALQEEEGMVGEKATPVWRAALTSSERALYDALAETQQYPAVATGPLLPLPGYTHSTGGETAGEEDAVYFDDMDAYAADWASGAVEEDAAMPRPSTRQVRPTRRGETAEGHADKVSLFSSLSPNTFTGRSLSSRSPNIRGLEKDVRGGQHHGANPSALKKMAAAAELTASAQRRRESRRVSFLVDGATPPLRVNRQPKGNATTVPRADLMRQFTH